jgi:hypothetical protein
MGIFMISLEVKILQNKLGYQALYAHMNNKRKMKKNLTIKKKKNKLGY